jgi:hypothetical protein
VRINRQSNANNPHIVDNEIRLVDETGTVVGANRAITNTWPTSLTLVTYGGPADLWGWPWTADMINDPDFGAVLSAYRNNKGNNPRVATVDSMQITVYYVFATTMAVACGDGTPVTYGDSVTCAVTVTRSTGSATPSGLVNWSAVGNDTFVPPSCTLTGTGDKTSCTTTYTPRAVGTGTHTVTASYNGGAHFAPNTATDDVAVLPRPLTVTADAKTKVYGSADPALTYTYTPPLVFGDTFTGSLARVAGENVGQYAINQGTLTIKDDYALTYTGAFLDITPATASCTVTPYTVTYDGTAHTATGQCLGVGDVVLSGLDLSGSTHTNPGTYTDTWSFTDTAGNYTSQTGTVTDTINKAAAVCTVTGYDVPYDGTAHTATGSCKGLFNDDLTGLNLSGTTHTNAGSYNDNWTFTNANYSDQNGSVTDKISKVDPTCSIIGWTGVYDAIAHGASGDCLGVDAKPLTGLDLGASYTNVPGGKANWSLTDTTGNYNNASGSVNIVISKADAVCTVTPYKVEYDKKAHTATGSCLGVDDEVLAGLVLSSTSHTAIGTYNDSWAFTDVTGNYNDAIGTAADEITKRAITVTADAKLKQAGQPDPALTYKVTSGSLLTGDEFTGSLARDPGEKSGTYAILQGSLTLPDYYVITYVGANLTITGKMIYLPFISKW